MTQSRHSTRRRARPCRVVEPSPAPRRSTARDQQTGQQEHAKADSRTGNGTAAGDPPRHGRSPDRRHLGPIGTAAFLTWCRQIDHPASGEDGFEDSRTRAERRGRRPGRPVHHQHPHREPPPPTAGRRRRHRRRSHGSRGSGDAGVAGHARRGGPQPGHHPGAGAGPGSRHRPGSTPAHRCRSPRSASSRARAQVVPIVMNGASQILDLGRACRPFNRAQRRAAAIRDRGCVAPRLHCTTLGVPRVSLPVVVPRRTHRHRQRRIALRLPPPDGPPPGLGHHPRPERLPAAHPPPHIDPTGRPRQHHRFTIQRISTGSPRPPGPRRRWSGQRQGRTRARETTERDGARCLDSPPVAKHSSRGPGPHPEAPGEHAEAQVDPGQ